MPHKALAHLSLRIQLLGNFGVLVNGRPVREDEWARRKSKLLVKLLALQPHHRLHREQIIELLWPERSAGAAANSLYKALHAARRSLEPQPRPGAVSNFILAQDDQIILTAPRELLVDAEEFERRAAAAFREQSAPALQAALELYQGDLLPEDLYEEWAAARREHLRSTYHRLLLTLGRMYGEQGRYESGLELLDRLVNLDPSNEEAHRQMMLFYASTGRRAEALRQYRRCEDALRVEMDGVPEKATAEIREQIVCGRITVNGGGGEGCVKQESVAAHTSEALTNLPSAVIINQIVRNTADAEDLVNETFITALEKIRRGDLREPERLSGFILAVARNLALGRLREGMRRAHTNIDEVPPPADPGRGPLEQLLLKERAEIVRQVLGELKMERDRQIIIRYYIMEDDKESVCASLGITLTHFNRVRFRAVGRFRELYEAKRGGKKPADETPGES